MNQVYKIKNSLRIPMAIALITSIPVFYDVFIKGLARQHIIIVGILVVIFFAFAINTLLRRISIYDDRISIRSIAGKKDIPLNEIKTIDGISLGRRQYVSINHKKKTYLIPNSFGNFTKILTSIKGLVKEDSRGQGFNDLETFPLNRAGDTIAAWITVVLLLIILVTRLK